MLKPSDAPATLRTYAALFEKVVPSDATLAAAKALGFQEIEQRRSALPLVDAPPRRV